ncbi:28S ribosomal protein S22 mitochondrial [Taenia crassiceps]|uniref:28S ribosomal protein S22 mitochondrial n=1 Tax=Taenia crassiceps TaxID=6207 RepID=A0ABR4QTB1_9CEST
MCSVASRFLRLINCRRRDGLPVPDLQSQFLTPRIHNLLHDLVSVSQPTTIHEPRFKVEKVHDIKLLSDAELQSVMQYSKMLTSQKLQMPPVMNERLPDDQENSIIVRNPELCGILPANQKLAFVDIGLDSSRRRRLILIREADGTLRHAHSSERDRLNQIFFPLPGRRLRTPSLFRDANLEVALKKGLHEYILDLILIQFEPDSPDYVRISQRVYQDAAEKSWACYCTTSDQKGGDGGNIVTRLRLTRHYGPFALYVISRLRRPACLVQEALFHQSLDTVYRLLVLTSLLHPDSDFAMKAIEQGIPPNTPEGDHFIPVPKTILEVVRTFIDTWPLESEQKNQLDLSLAQCYHFDDTNSTTIHS